VRLSCARMDAFLNCQIQMQVLDNIIVNEDIFYLFNFLLQSNSLIPISEFDDSGGEVHGNC